MNITSAEHPWQATTSKALDTLQAENSSPSHVNANLHCNPQKLITIKNSKYLNFPCGLGNVRIQARSAHKSTLDVLLKTRETLISREIVLKYMLPFGWYRFEIAFMDSLCSIPKSLSIFPTVEYQAPIFESTARGDFDALLSSLRNKEVSPFALDEYGHSLLHVSLRKPFFISILSTLGTHQII